MRPALGIGLSVFLLPALGSAQEFQQPALRGYVFFGPGTVTYPGKPASTYVSTGPKGTAVYTFPAIKSERHTTFHLGGGAEFLIYGGLGVGAEIGAVGASGGAFALADVNGTYHFTSFGRSGKWVPFVTGGYTRAGGQEWGENWFNFGGGVKCWFHGKKGLLLEFRDHIDPAHAVAIHYAEFRVGLLWP